MTQSRVAAERGRRTLCLLEVPARGDRSGAASDGHGRLSVVRLPGQHLGRGVDPARPSVVRRTAGGGGNESLVRFYREALVRTEFLPVLDAWQAELDAGRTIVVYAATEIVGLPVA